MKEHLSIFLTTYIIHKSYAQCELVKIMADRLFTILNTIDENEDVIIHAIADLLPINRGVFNYINITSEMVIDALNAYVLDGGSRDFKNMIDPDSEVVISDSENDDNEAIMLQYLDCLSE